MIPQMSTSNLASKYHHEALSGIGASIPPPPPPLPPIPILSLSSPISQNFSCPICGRSYSPSISPMVSRSSSPIQSTSLSPSSPSSPLSLSPSNSLSFSNSSAMVDFTCCYCYGQHLFKGGIVYGKKSIDEKEIDKEQEVEILDREKEFEQISKLIEEHKEVNREIVKLLQKRETLVGNLISKKKALSCYQVEFKRGESSMSYSEMLSLHSLLEIMNSSDNNITKRFRPQILSFLNPQDQYAGAVRLDQILEEIPCLRIHRVRERSQVSEISGPRPISKETSITEGGNRLFEEEEEDADDLWVDQSENDYSDSLPFFSYGRSVSTYPYMESKGKRDGSPICDYFSVRATSNRTIMVVTDGCNWGEKSQLASISANEAFRDYLSQHQSIPANLHQYVLLLLTALQKAHDAVISSSIAAGKKDPYDAGTTTLLGGVLVELNIPEDQREIKEPRWGFLFISVGDCKAFHHSIRTGVSTDLTGNTRPSKDGRDPGGRLGPLLDPINGVIPADTRNLIVRFQLCCTGDMICLMTDGVHDNLDPEFLGLQPSFIIPQFEEDRAWNSLLPQETELLKETGRANLIHSLVYDLSPNSIKTATSNILNLNQHRLKKYTNISSSSNISSISSSNISSSNISSSSSSIGSTNSISSSSCSNISSSSISVNYKKTQISNKNDRSNLNSSSPSIPLYAQPSTNSNSHLQPTNSPSSASFHLHPLSNSTNQTLSNSTNNNNLTPQKYVDSLIDHTLQITKSSRHFLRHNKAKLPANYLKYPGKLDHTTSVCLCVQNLASSPGRSSNSSTSKIITSTFERLTKKGRSNNCPPGGVSTPSNKDHLSLYFNPQVSQEVHDPLSRSSTGSSGSLTSSGSMTITSNEIIEEGEDSSRVKSPSRSNRLMRSNGNRVSSRSPSKTRRDVSPFTKGEHTVSSPISSPVVSPNPSPRSHSPSPPISVVNSHGTTVSVADWTPSLSRSIMEMENRINRSPPSETPLEFSFEQGSSLSPNINSGNLRERRKLHMGGYRANFNSDRSPMRREPLLDERVAKSGSSTPESISPELSRKKRPSDES